MSVNLINKTTGQLSKIAGKESNGELIPSTSYYQSGSFYFASGIDGGGNGNQQVTLSTDMPDNDYVVVLSPNNDDIIFTVQKKTKTGFQINAYNKNAYMQQPTGTYQVFKLMTDENRALDEQAIAKNMNNISDLQTDVTGLQAVVPSTASASNKLATAENIQALTNSVATAQGTATTANNTANSALNVANAKENAISYSMAFGSWRVISPAANTADYWSLTPPTIPSGKKVAYWFAETDRNDAGASVATVGYPQNGTPNAAIVVCSNTASMQVRLGVVYY